MNAPTLTRPAPVSRVGLAAAALAALIDLLYLVIIANEGNGWSGRVAFVATLIAAAAACALIGSTRTTAPARLPWLAVATGALASLGYLGLFSIGLGLLIAGVLAGIAWGSASRSLDPSGARRHRGSAFGWALAGAAFPWIGIALT